MLGFVDGEVLICKGRLTDLENVPFLKLILTDNLDRLSRLLRLNTYEHRLKRSSLKSLVPCVLAV